MVPSLLPELTPRGTPPIFYAGKSSLRDGTTGGVPNSPASLIWAGPGPPLIRAGAGTFGTPPNSNSYN